MKKVLRWTADNHQKSVHFRDPKIRVQGWNEQPLRNFSQNSAKWHWKRQCGGEKKRPIQRVLQWNSGQAMTAQAAGFFLTNQRTLAANMPWHARELGVLAKFSLLFFFSGIPWSWGQMPTISAHLNSAPPFNHPLGKGQGRMPAAGRFPKGRTIVLTGIKIPWINVNMHPI